MVIALVVVVTFAALAAPISLGVYFQSQANAVQLTVVCTSAEANIQQLQALAALHRRLGVPIDFVIPPLPPECP